MNSSNKIVHGLWIGSELSALEILTLKSFIFHGHEFHLWTYAPLKTQVPDGVVLHDANKILPEQSIFRYKHASNLGHGKGSYAGFSDIFRYKLLYEKGGWWADMDVTCLQPLNFSEPYVFRDNDVFPSVGNIMKCPKKSMVMKNSLENAIVQVTAENTYWSKPIEILCDQISSQKLTSFIKKGICNPDIWEVVDLYRYSSASIPKQYYIFHWMNEHYRKQGVDKNTVVKHSPLWELMKKHHVSARVISDQHMI